MRILSKGPLFQTGRRRQPLQAGRGLGNLLASLARGLIPVTKSILKSPITRKIAKRGLVETANVAADMLQGSSLNEAAGKRIHHAKQQLVQKLQAHGRPKMLPRAPPKRGSKAKKARKGRLKQDLFM